MSAHVGAQSAHVPATHTCRNFWRSSVVIASLRASARSYSGGSGYRYSVLPVLEDVLPLLPPVLPVLPRGVMWRHAVECGGAGPPAGQVCASKQGPLQPDKRLAQRKRACPHRWPVLKSISLLWPCISSAKLQTCHGTQRLNRKPGEWQHRTSEDKSQNDTPALYQQTTGKQSNPHLGKITAKSSPMQAPTNKLTSQWARPPLEGHHKGQELVRWQQGEGGGTS